MRSGQTARTLSSLPSPFKTALRFSFSKSTRREWGAFVEMMEEDSESEKDSKRTEPRVNPSLT